MASCSTQPLAVAGATPQPRIVTVPGSASMGHNTDLAAGRVVLNMWSRFYLADSCGPLPASYTAWQLLGRTFSFSVELSGTGCGCNLAVYTAEMQTNTQVGTCSDGTSGLYYCDANSVCGVRCDEIDIMEANHRAFHSVAHQWWDGSGRGGGFGGSHGHPGTTYGPGGSVIDTARPFRVHTTFTGGGSGGRLSSITTRLEQEGRQTSWSMAPQNYLRGLHSSTNRGLTLVLSYWSSGNNGMWWLDRPPCADYASPTCGAATLYDFAITGGAPPPPLPPPPLPPLPCAPPLPTGDVRTCDASAALSLGRACACSYSWADGCDEAPNGVELVCER